VSGWTTGLIAGLPVLTRSAGLETDLSAGAVPHPDYGKHAVFPAQSHSRQLRRYLLSHQSLPILFNRRFPVISGAAATLMALW
jgi:hypothetical protein